MALNAIQRKIDTPAPRRLLPVGGVYRHSRAMCRSEG
ncbi:hypothetical protein J659_4240, partial [Acinetobacter baumannii 1406589]